MNIAPPYSYTRQNILQQSNTHYQNTITATTFIGEEMDLSPFFHIVLCSIALVMMQHCQKSIE